MAARNELREIILYLDREEVTGEFSRELDDAVKAIKSSEERRLEYMMLYIRDNEMRAEGRKQGRAEGLQEGMKKGQILQAVRMYRNLLHYDDRQIIESLKADFSLTEQEAEACLAEQQ